MANDIEEARWRRKETELKTSGEFTQGIYTTMDVLAQAGWNGELMSSKVAPFTALVDYSRKIIVINIAKAGMTLQLLERVNALRGTAYGCYLYSFVESEGYRDEHGEGRYSIMACKPMYGHQGFEDFASLDY